MAIIKSRSLVTLSLLGGLSVLAGCGNTLSGAKQDASRDTQAVDTAARNAAATTKQAAVTVGAAADQAAADVKAATVLTPLIKAAIIRDPVLNDSRNLINVNTEAAVVHLRGHVLDDSMRGRAEQDAQKVLTDHHSTQKIDDELTVASGA